MTRYLALLRGINLGSTNKVAMPDLKALLDGLGYGGVRTHLQTGNVVFDADPGDEAALAERLRRQLAEGLGIDVPVLLRGAAELTEVATGNPLADGCPEPSRLQVTFLSEPPDPDRVPRLEPLAAEGERFAVVGRTAFLYCPNGYGRTKLSNTNLEKRLGVVATTRTWKVVNALHGMMSG